MKKALKNVLGIIKDGFLYIFTGNMLGQIFGFVAGIIIARIVSKEEYAYYSYASNILSYLSMVCFLGLPSSILNYCGGKCGKKFDRDYISWSIRIGGLFQGALGVLVCIGFSFANIPFPESKKYIYLIAFIPVISGIKNVYQSYLQSRMEYKKYTGLSLIYFIIYLLSVLVFISRCGVYGVIGSIYMAFAVTVIVGMYWSNKLFDNKNNYGLDSIKKKSFFITGITILSSSFFSTMIPTNETFLVNNLIGSTAIVAEYRVATLIPSQLMVVASSLVAYFYPQVVNMKGDRRLNKYMIKIGIGTGLIIVFIALVGMIFTKPIINLVYGEKYVGAVQMAYILWIVSAVNSGIRTVPNSMLLALDDRKFSVGISVCTCIVHFCLDYYFITTAGIMGIAFASLISYGLSGVVLWRRLLRITKDV